MFNYVVTAHRPTAVPCAVTGNFTAPNELNLILSAAGLDLVADVPIYGRVAVMELIRFPGDKQDSLFLSLEKYRFCVLTYDSATGEIKTRANGDTHDRVGRPTELGQIGFVDPLVRAIGLHLYDGQLRIIPVDNKGALQESFNVRLEELVVLDMTFLHGCDDAPTVAILYQDAKSLRHVKTYKLQLKDKELQEGPWTHANAEPTANMLVPVPAPTGGVLIIGDTTITYQGRTTGTMRAMANKFGSIKACGKIDADGTRFLVGDNQGVLGLVVLLKDGQNVTDVKIETLGQTSIASTIRYLDNGYVYVGSVGGDSQLIRLLTAKDATGSLVEQVDSYANLGPIVDFCVVDLERQGQGQVVTCSGSGKDGSLRIIRNGIGLNEQATIELSGVKGIWSLRASSSAKYDKFLAVSFVNETRFLAITDGEELEEAEIPGFASGSRTIFCGNVLGDMAVQVTSASVRLINATSLALLSEWKPASAQINVASCSQSQVVLATGGGRLVYLEIRAETLHEVKAVVLEHEIACINVTPLGDPQQASPICAIGMWTDITVRVLRLPTLEVIIKEKLGGDIIPRSLLFASFEGVGYLLCGLGDGHLFSFVIDPTTAALSNPKKLSLGTQPILLNSFRAKGVLSVFAASDRPMVIYSRNKKLLYSTVNLKEVYFMCPFNTEAYPESLAVATESALTIGNIDEIQKLHIRKVPLGEMPRRIAHQEASRMFGVLTSKLTVDPTGEEIEAFNFRLIDDATFEAVNSYPLQATESGVSVLSLNFTDDPVSYFIVGTAFIVSTESEPTKGRVLVFSVAERKLALVCELEVKGCVYSMSALNGKLLITVNSRLRILSLGATEGGGKELVAVAQSQAHIIALHTAVRGDFIAVGDLMKSINLNVFKPADNTIEEIARDYNPNWMTSMEILDDDTFVGGEQYYNVFVVRRNSEAATDEERLRLLTVGEYHTGEFINRFRHGSLVMRLTEGTDTVHASTLLFASVAGTIGVLATLTPEQHEFFLRLQNILADPKIIGGVGGLKHKEWRSFANDRKTVDATSFIDGDLVELFLDLPRARQDEVARAMELSTEEVSRRIEHLSHTLH